MTNHELTKEKEDLAQKKNQQLQTMLAAAAPSNVAAVPPPHARAHVSSSTNSFS